MSFTTTISWWSSSSNPTPSRALGSSFSPLNSSSYASTIRRGVSRSPSRSMSSPIAVMMSRTACSMTGLSTLHNLLRRLHPPGGGEGLPPPHPPHTPPPRRRPRPGAGENPHHPHHAPHRLHVVHAQHVRSLRRGEGHRRR